MKIAIVGAGVSGLGAAYALDGDHELTIFEKDNRLGGHASTVDVDHYGPRISVDTGFIIFNRSTYPNLTRAFRDLGVKTVPTQMSFSISLDDGRFEWATNNLFAQRRNLINPRFYLLLMEILRFFRVANANLAAGAVGEVSLREYLARHHFKPDVVDRFLTPMGASIWSASATQFLDYPAEVLLEFMKNHQLLRIKQPVWLTVKDGSRTYVEKLAGRLRATIRKGVTIAKVRRTNPGVVLTDATGAAMEFDQVILACHSTDALALLEGPLPPERDMLSKIRYTDNLTVLHGDASLMPKRRGAWSSWNYVGSSAPERASDAVGITYWMNSLQAIDKACPLFVSLNPSRPPKPELVFASFNYAHPQFDRDAINAQKQLSAIQGEGNVWFCGAYAGYGFHEDGFRSGLEIANALAKTGVVLPGHPRIFA
jgi:predicted NAD/FAD-binding protein